MEFHYFFFFKQKTAYEMRISDWSSDVCSSDLAAAGTGLGQAGLLIGFIDGVDLSLRWRLIEEFACPGEVLGAAAVGEESVVADPVKAGWQDVEEKAADELIGGEGHELVAGAAFGAVVLPFERSEEHPFETQSLLRNSS